MVKYMKLGNVRIRRLVGWLVLLVVAVPLLLWAADDVKIKLAPGGASTFAIQDSGTNTRFRVDDTGNVTLGIWNATNISAAKGGTALDTSASTGVPSISSGTWSVNATLPASLGGTGQNTYATGDMLYASGANTLSRLTIGLPGQSLGVAGVPTWQYPNFAHANEVTVDTFAVANTVYDLISAVITPRSTSVRIKITVCCEIRTPTSAADSIYTLRIRRGAATELISFSEFTTDDTEAHTLSFTYVDSPATTSATTYYLTGSSNVAGNTAVAKSITLEEVGP